MLPAFLQDFTVQSTLVRESVDTDPREARMLRPKGRPQARLALRSARATDGEALQIYIRGLSPPSRYNRFLGALSELPPSELARALAANGRDTLTMLLASTTEDCDRVVGEARVALSCAERAGEFAMSIADGWRRFGVGSALLEEIERRAAADGIEWLFGDVLRTNEGMIALARSRGFGLGPGSRGASCAFTSGWRPQLPTRRAGNGPRSQPPPADRLGSHG